MTDKEKQALVKAAFPKIEGIDLDWAVHLVQKNDTPASFKERIGVAPHVLRNEVPLAGGLASGGKALAGLIKALLTKKGAAKAAEAGTEAVATAAKAKMSLKKKALIGGGVLAVGQAGANLMKGQTSADSASVNAAQAQAQEQFASAIANADAQGIDVNKYLQSTTAKQLGLGANNIADFMAARGYGTSLTGLGGVGIYTGKTTTGGSYVGSTFVPKTGKETVSLAEWNKRFPVAGAELVAIKNRFVDAGVLDPSAGIDQVKAAWTKYGQLSLDYARAGNTVSPWDLLKLQKQLSGGSGGGSKTSVTIDESPMAESDIRALTRRQLSQSLGLANIDEDTYQKILKVVRDKEKKNPTKTTVTTVGSKTTRKTVQGYGQADVLADAEAYAKQDPRYAEFQTTSVFGDALNKALGLRG